MVSVSSRETGRWRLVHWRARLQGASLFVTFSMEGVEQPTYRLVNWSGRSVHVKQLLPPTFMHAHTGSSESDAASGAGSAPTVPEPPFLELAHGQSMPYAWSELTAPQVARACTPRVHHG